MAPSGLITSYYQGSRALHGKTSWLELALGAQHRNEHDLHVTAFGTGLWLDLSLLPSRNLDASILSNEKKSGQKENFVLQRLCTLCWYTRQLLYLMPFES